MFHRLFPFRRLLATTFLVVFVNVFVGQCWCATANPARPSAAGPAHCAMAMPVGGAAPAMHGHACCQAKAKAGKPGEISRQPIKKTSGKHDCCKDKSASLLSSLGTPAAKHLPGPAPAVLPAATVFHFRPQAAQWDPTRAVALLPPRQLKPKIPDIRIFIQSLTV